MSKIKFSKEWYRDNKIAINCKTNEEAIQLFREFIKIDIRWNKNDNKLSIHNTYFDDNKDNICYTIEDNFYNLTYQYKDYFLKEGYTIINFSDLEFESDIIKNEPKITKTENEECGYDLPVEVDKSDKNHILRGNVKLNSGDIIHVRYKELHKNGLTGIITSNGILYTAGLFDSLSCIQSTIINEELEWYIPSKDIKDESLLVSQLLFKGELKDRLKELIIYVEDNKPKKRTVETFEVKFCRNSIVVKSPYISDEDIKIGDVISPTDGFLTDRYGIVTDIKCKELTEEELNKYAKITKIK